jgi:hypothetical protein
MRCVVCNGDLVASISSNLDSSIHSSNLDDFRAGLSCLDGVADLFAEQGARHRRNMRQRSARGSGFILADYPESLPAPSSAHDGHGRTEMHTHRILLGGASWLARRELQRRSRRSRDRSGSSPPGRRRALLRACELTLDLRKALRRHEVGMRRDRTLRQLCARIFAVRLFDECPAHDDEPILLLLYLRSSGWQLPDIGGRRQNQMGRRAAITWNLSARKKFSPIERRCQRVLVQDVIDLTAPIREE